MSAHQAEDARLEAVEVLAQSPYAETLWRIDFVCDPENSEKRLSIYTKHLATRLEEKAAERVIELSGLCPVFSTLPKVMGIFRFQTI